MVLRVFFLLALFLSAVSAAPSATFTSQTPTFNPPQSLVTPDLKTVIVPQSLTNAQRLRRGLPLKAPRRRFDYDYDGSTPPDAPQPPYPTPSGTACQPKRGFIQISDSSSGSVIGFVGNTFVVNGEYGVIPSSAPQDQRLVVTVNPEVPGAQNIQTSNGPDDRFAYLGSILGFGSPSEDLGPGSFSYTYVGATKQTPPGSKPQAVANSFTSSAGIQREAESAVFTYHPEADDSITLKWINGDDSYANCPNFIGVIDDDNILFATGDKEEFTKIFGDATWVEWKFVPMT
ncbi:hypothetical protein D9758_010196 [Tetrapyrgos nigripes]|uniref:Uncharacterized protein n=1 Tax=Tetrapyrgos nigripes TaxID=182062 RepID=A0A8H5CXC5_9AGAR|nr:hypothetical protein D9758_010196 [Tetrapyrgos nigripes]